MKSSANTLAQQLYGSSAIKTKDGYENFVQPIIDRLGAGEDIDRIADDLRFQGQSTQLSGVMREAVQQITSDYSAAKTQTILDKFDDTLDTGDVGKVQDFLKKIAVESTTADESRQIRGKERTLEFIQEIWQDLQTYRPAGIRIARWQTASLPQQRNALQNTNPAPSDALVIFGITGDLAYKKIFPALEALEHHVEVDVEAGEEDHIPNRLDHHDHAHGDGQVVDHTQRKDRGARKGRTEFTTPHNIGTRPLRRAAVRAPAAVSASTTRACGE
jgi:hypothetical protein